MFIFDLLFTQIVLDFHFAIMILMNFSIGTNER